MPQPAHPPPACAYCDQLAATCLNNRHSGWTSSVRSSVHFLFMFHNRSCFFSPPHFFSVCSQPDVKRGRIPAREAVHVTASIFEQTWTSRPQRTYSTFNHLTNRFLLQWWFLAGLLRSVSGQAVCSTTTSGKHIANSLMWLKKNNKKQNNTLLWAEALTWRARCPCWPWRRTSPGYRCPWWRCSGWRQTFQRKCDQDAAPREEERHQPGENRLCAAFPPFQPEPSSAGENTLKGSCRENVGREYLSCSPCKKWNLPMFSKP